MDKSIQRMIYEQLERSPDRRALTHIDLEGEFSWSTLEEIHARAAGYAAKLAELGLGRGDVCILNLQSDEFCSTVLLAVLLLGGLPLLVAPPTIQIRERYSSLVEILKHVIDKTDPRIVIAPEEMEEMADEFGNRSGKTRILFGKESLSPEPGAEIPEVIPAEIDVAALQLTSGTTGVPRICVWKQKGVVAALDYMFPAMDLNRDDICLNWTPLYHDMGLVNNYLLCLTKGVPLAMLGPIDFIRKPALWLQSLQATGSTVTWSPNFSFAITAERVRDEEMEGVSLRRVKAFWNAAERIHLETIEAFYKRFAPFDLRRESLKTNFGLAENIGGATFSDTHGEFLVDEVDTLELQENGIALTVENPSEGQRTIKVVGVGHPCPGMDVKILSQEGDLLPDGHVGEVALHTPSRMSGYLDQDDETRYAIFGDLLRTGDLGYLRDGELFWVGRTRERITTLGKKIDPSDFERVLLKVPNLQRGRFAAFGVDDAKLGSQRVVIATEVKDPDSGTFSDILAEIRSQVYLQLGVRVHDIVLLPKGILTKTSSGKRRHGYFHQLYVDDELESLRLQQ